MATGDAARLTPAEGRRFAFTVGTAFLALAGVLLWRDRLLFAASVAAVGFLLILAGFVAPAHLGPVYRAWMGLAALLSKVTTPVVMGVLYFLVLTPTGLLMRALGKDPLRRHGGHGSNWLERETPRSDLTRQF